VERNGSEVAAASVIAQLRFYGKRVRTAGGAPGTRSSQAPPGGAGPSGAGASQAGPSRFAGALSEDQDQEMDEGTSDPLAELTFGFRGWTGRACSCGGRAEGWTGTAPPR